MRATFFNTIERYYKEDKNLYVFTGDLGYKLFDRLRSYNAGRFYNTGIAEANMVGLASGLALCGNKVYCYSIIPFLVMRAFEQIRIDVDYHDLDVVLVGAGGGFSYGLEGITHFGLEDLCLMSSLQNMTVVVPADKAESVRIAELSYDHKGPMYIRLGKTGEPDVHTKKPDFRIGKGMVLREGKRVAIFAFGNMVRAALDAILELKKIGISPTIVNMHTLKPFDKDLVHNIASRHDVIVSVEEHILHGGLGSQIALVLAGSEFSGQFKCIAIPEKLSGAIGSAEYLRTIYGLTPKNITKTVRDALIS